jgi:glycosyltransferase involved in cell wall biosynthesis
MAVVTVIIITKNEARTIGACIRSIGALTDDIIVVDAESTDETRAIARSAGATVLPVPWQGYGHARNTGAARARHNWILSLDADERMTPALIAEIAGLVTDDESRRYKFRRINFFEEKRIRFGTLGHELVTRLYNRKTCSWNLVPVHETLCGSGKAVLLRGSILHDGIPDPLGFRRKKEEYARLGAIKYAAQGRRATWVKRNLAAPFNAAKSLIFRLGFLDGEVGWFLAKTTYLYTKEKYRQLALRTTKDLDVSTTHSRQPVRKFSSV